LSPGLRGFLFTACLVVTVAGLRLASTVLVPLALALFITVVSLPLLQRLLRRGVPAALSVLAVVMLDISVLLGVVWLLIRSFAEVGGALPSYAARLGELEDTFLTWLGAHGVEIDVIPYMDLIPSENLVGLVSTFLRGATDVVSTAFLVVLITVFLLAEVPIFPRKLQIAWGLEGDNLPRTAGVLREVQRYLGLKTISSAVTGLLIGIAAWLLAVDFALLWGLLAFFLNFIPTVGSILAAIPAVSIAALQHGFGPALVLGAVFLAVNMLIGNFIEPMVVGRRLGLSTLVVILSLVFWGYVWGPVGMFLSVPLAMVIKIVLEHNPDYRWIATMMAGVSVRHAHAEEAARPRTPPA
jgi:AI-2 transport protein TqsA